ncbi:MAG: hypothetical protein U5K72_01945 [Balneolaceae bacterium]|nr:hypothetical protein [Balneolaceae bacterium]
MNKFLHVFLIQFILLFFGFAASTIVAQTFAPFITTWKTDNPGASNDQSIRIPMIGNGYDFNVDWGDGTVMRTTTRIPAMILNIFLNTPIHPQENMK